MYNTKYFADNKLAGADVVERPQGPEVQGKLIVPPLNNTYGLQMVIMLARLNGGGEKNIDPGFKVMKDDVAPNVLAYEPSARQDDRAFQNGRP